MKLRVAGTTGSSMVNGEGIRFVIFTQGCEHYCTECHNTHTWDPKGGHEIEIDELVKDALVNRELLDGVTISGGEPLLQYKSTLELAKKLSEHGLSIWLWTGYLMEEVRGKYPDILDYVDVIIDGRYMHTLPKLEWRGSSNQNIWKKKNKKWVKE